MLHTYIEQFLNYCQVSNFPVKSIEALAAHLKHFDRYCKTLAIDSIADVTYQQLLTFVADFGEPSVHVKKNRVWALRHFYHFLRLNHIIDDNPAAAGFVLTPTFSKPELAGCTSLIHWALS